LAKLPVPKGEELVKFLEHLGFKKIRMKGSHTRLKHHDGRVTTVPIHKGRTIPKGLLRKIIREDLEIDLEEFIRLYEDYKGK